MTVAVAACAAVGAAALFALSTASHTRALRDVERQIRGSAANAIPSGMAPGLRVLAGALSSPRWLVGSAIGVAAFGLHALALHDGNLTLVQPLLITMVLFALPASRAMGGPRTTRAELLWAAVLVVALGAFFTAGDPATPSSNGVDAWPAVLAAIIAVSAIGTCIRLARRRTGSTAAALLGAGAGIAFAGSAALLKTATNLLAQGVVVLVAGWQLYALLGVGALGIILSQLAYRAGPVSASLPAMNSLNPVASILIGVAVFDERFRTGAVPLMVEGIALAAMTLATVLLSRGPNATTADPSRTGTAPQP